MTLWLIHNPWGRILTTIALPSKEQTIQRFVRSKYPLGRMPDSAETQRRWEALEAQGYTVHQYTLTKVKETTNP